MATRRVIAAEPAKEQAAQVGPSPEQSVQPAPVTASVNESIAQTPIQRPQRQDPRPAVAAKKDPAPIKNIAPQKESRPNLSPQKPAPKPTAAVSVVDSRKPQRPQSSRVDSPARREAKPSAKPSSPVNKIIKTAPLAKKEPPRKPAQRTQAKHGTKKAQSEEEEPQEFGSWPLIVVAVVLGLTILGIMWATWDSPASDSVQNTSTETDYGRFGYDPAKIQTFGDLYAEMKLLDQRYQTDLHQERLGKDMIPPKFIAGYIDRVDALSAAVNVSGSNETEINSQFLTARRRMLVSQDYFQQALRFGAKGVVTTAFDCADIPTVIKASELYNRSFEVGRLAIPRLDFVLAKSGEARSQLGLNTQKMRWYVSTFGDIKHLVDTNLWLVDQLCVKRQSLNNTQDADVEKAREEFEQDFPGAVVP